MKGHWITAILVLLVGAMPWVWAAYSKLYLGNERAMAAGIFFVFLFLGGAATLAAAGVLLLFSNSVRQGRPSLARILRITAWVVCVAAVAYMTSIAWSAGWIAQ